jgi:hypothetical protein
MFVFVYYLYYMSYINQLFTNTEEIHIAGFLECGAASNVSKELIVPLKQRTIYSLFNDISTGIHL